uniref:CUB domain-containing protein n=1 Tax=Ciona intestinalis TaxID=7719 RepID=F6TQB3_CIOIN
MGSFFCGTETSRFINFRKVNYAPSDNCSDFTRDNTAPQGLSLVVLFTEIGPSSNCTIAVGIQFITYKQGDYLMYTGGPSIRVRCQPGAMDSVSMQFVGYNPSICPSQTTSLNPGASVTVGNYNSTINYADSLFCRWRIIAANTSDNCNFTFVNTGVQSLPAGDYVTVADRLTQKGILNPLTGVHTIQSNDLSIDFMSNNDMTANNGVRFI